MIPIATLTAVLDSLAAAVSGFRAAVGDGEPGTVSGRADADVATLAGLDDIDVQRDLTPVFATRAATVRAPTLYRALNGMILQRAFDRHFGNYGGLSGFLKTNDTRVHEHLLLIGFSLDADAVFMANPIMIARFDAGVFESIATVDTAHYAAAPLEVVVEVKGATPSVAHVRVIGADGIEVAHDVAIAGNAAADTRIAIAGNARFVGVADITVDGGDAADRFRVDTKLERNVA